MLKNLNRRSFFSAAAASLALPAASFAGGRDDVLTPLDLTENGLTFTDLAHGLDGQRVTISGFMTPPVAGVENLAVLAERPTKICPVCNDRTGDTAMAICGPCSVGEGGVSGRVLAIYAEEEIKSRPFNVRVDVEGILKIGTAFDDRVGFMSSSQLMDAKYSVAKLT